MKLFPFARNGCEQLVEFLPNILKIFGHIINYLLTSLVGSVLVKYRTSISLHGRRLAALGLVRTKNVGPIFH